VGCAIEESLATIHCAGLLERVEPGRFELLDPGSGVRVVMRLEAEASYILQAGGEERADQPYEALEIHHLECVAYLTAYRTKPKSFPVVL